MKKPESSYSSSTLSHIHHLYLENIKPNPKNKKFITTIQTKFIQQISDTTTITMFINKKYRTARKIHN